jgi:DDE superfamily endonuclease
LILDGHSSHVNMAFISLADSFRILILILPPHSTHRLQPLDVGLFGPLVKAYSKRLDAYTHRGLGWVSMTKRLFWPIFRDA